MIVNKIEEEEEGRLTLHQTIIKMCNLRRRDENWMQMQ